MVHERYRQTVGRRHIINQCAHYHSPQYDQNVRNIEHCCHSRLAVLAWKHSKYRYECDAWMQALSRAGQRAVKLQDSLRVVRQNAAHVDELMVWLNDCHILLTAKDKDSIPDDLTVVDALVKEHTVCTSTDRWYIRVERWERWLLDLGSAKPRRGQWSWAVAKTRFVRCCLPLVVLDSSDVDDELLHSSDTTKDRWWCCIGAVVQEFHEELLAKTVEVETLLKSLPASTTTMKGGRSPRTTPGRPSTAHNGPHSASVAANAVALQRKWTTISRMSCERNKKLHDMYNRLLEVRSQRHHLRARLMSQTCHVSLNCDSKTSRYLTVAVNWQSWQTSLSLETCLLRRDLFIGRRLRVRGIRRCLTCCSIYWSTTRVRHRKLTKRNSNTRINVSLSLVTSDLL